MKHITISFIDNTDPEKNIINIKDINNLPNMFFDQISVKNHLNISDGDIKNTLDLIVSKLKPNGNIDISILDLKVFSQYYINGLIQNDQYMSTVKNINQCLSINNVLLYTKDKNNLSVASISYNEYFILFKIHRVSV